MTLRLLHIAMADTAPSVVTHVVIMCARDLAGAVGLLGPVPN